MCRKRKANFWFACNNFNFNITVSCCCYMNQSTFTLIYVYYFILNWLGPFFLKKLFIMCTNFNPSSTNLMHFFCQPVLHPIYFHMWKSQMPHLLGLYLTDRWWWGWEEKSWWTWMQCPICWLFFKVITRHT